MIIFAGLPFIISTIFTPIFIGLIIWDEKKYKDIVKQNEKELADALGRNAPKDEVDVIRGTLRLALTLKREYISPHIPFAIYCIILFLVSGHAILMDCDDSLIVTWVLVLLSFIPCFAMAFFARYNTNTRRQLGLYDDSWDKEDAMTATTAVGLGIYSVKNSFDLATKWDVGKKKQK